MKQIYDNPLRPLVKAASVPIRDIAKAVGIHPNTITNLIRPDGPVDMDTPQKLAAYFGYRLVISLEPLDGEK